MTRKLTLLFMGLVIFGLTASKAQLAGSYTIGGATPDFATVVDAATALTTQGVSAPVTFNIRDGVYTGKVVLTAITGASFTNTITFQSENADSTLVTITAPSVASGAANYTVSLNGADYITFKQLTIERSGTAVSARVIDLAAGADYNNFTNCIITNGATAATGNFNVIVYSAPGTTDNFNVFSGNVILNGSYGFYFYGGSLTTVENGNMIMNNIFSNQNVSAIQTANEADLMVSGNTITGTTATYLTGILITNCNGNTMVMENKINITNGGTGISVQQCNGLTGEVVVANNFVTINTLLGTTNTGAYGIRLSGCTKTGIYYNNVLNLADFTAASCFAFQATGAGSNVFVYNNIFDAAFSYVVGVANTAVTAMDHNDLYSYGFFFGLFNGSTALSDFVAWQSGTPYDSNSVSVDPLFVSNTDLHIQTFALNGIATPIAGITTDIDGQLRDVTTPDIGADETTPPSNDVGVTKLLSPVNGSCGDVSQTVAAIVRNYAALPQSNIMVTAIVSGTQNATLTGTIVGPIGVYKSDTVYFTPTLNTVAGDSLTIMFYTTILNDEDNSNDTLTVDSIYINAIPAPPVVPATVSTCINSPANVTATFPSTQQVYWYNAASGGQLVQTGNPLTVSPTVSTTYYAEVRDTAVSGLGCLRITEIELNDNSVAGGDYVEIQNISGGPIDATGWVVASSDSYTDINLVNATEWSLGNINAGEIQIRYDGSTTGANYWGQNLLYNGGQPGWLMIVDNLGNIVDFVAWQWSQADLLGMNVTVNGFNINVGSSWNGDGAGSCSTGSISRFGSIDNDNATDFGCPTQTEGTQNANLSSIFAACGSGCSSDRVAVTVDLLPLPTVFLGNDTTIALPNTVTLDAGAGFTSYLWSTGATTQTIVVSISSTYSVSVTDANGCVGIDVISVAVLTGINDFGANSSVSIVPNPAKDFIKVALNNFANDNYTISLINNLGQFVLTSTLDVQSSTAEQTLDLSNVERGVYYVEIKSKNGVSHNRIIVQ